MNISKIDLKVRVSFDEPLSIITYVTERARRKYSKENGIPSDVPLSNDLCTQIGLQALEKFNEKKSALTKQVKSLSNLFEPCEDYLKMNDILIRFIKKAVDQYLVNSPENTKLVESYDNFRESFANLRGENNPKLIDHLNNYFNFIKDEISKSSNSNFDPQLFEKKWQVFQNIVRMDADMLEIPLGTLKGLGEEFLDISVEHLIEINNIVINEALQSYFWVLDLVIKKLEPFAKMPQDHLMNFSQALIDKLVNFKKNILPKLVQLSLTEESTYSSDVEKFIINIFIEVASWLQALEGSATSFIDEDNLIKFAFDSDKSKKNPPSFHVRFGIAATINSLLNRFIDKKSQLIKENTTVSPFIEGNIKHLNNSKEFYENFHQCYYLLNTFLITPFIPLLKVTEAFCLWAKKRKFKKGELKSLIESQKRPNLTAEEALKFVCGDDSVNEKMQRGKGKKRRGKRTKPVKNPPQVQPSNSLPSLPKKEQKPLPKTAPAPSLTLSTVSTLAELVRKTTHTIPRHAVRQAYMYFLDLMTSMKAFSATMSQPAKRSYLIMGVHSAYLCLEQILQFQLALENPGNDPRDLNGGHNLIQLIKETKLDPKVKRDSLIQELYLGHFWARNPLEQMERRKACQADIPDYLQDVKTIYEVNDVASSSLQPTIDKINRLAAKISEFSKNIPSLENKSKSLSITHQVMPLQGFSEWKDDIIQKNILTCRELNSKIPLPFRSKFKQAMLHLEMIKGIYDELSQKEISSDLFSLLVRSLIFWENAALEGIVQTLVGIKKGVITDSHKLSILDDIDLNHKLEEEQHSFLSNLHDIHNISRYPFSTGEKHPLHDLILQGELLRERPELGQEDPFQLQGITALNYLPVSREGLTPKEMNVKLRQHAEMIMSIIQKKLLPEIESCLTSRL